MDQGFWPGWTDPEGVSDGVRCPESDGSISIDGYAESKGRSPGGSSPDALRRLTRPFNLSSICAVRLVLRQQSTNRSLDVQCILEQPAGVACRRCEPQVRTGSIAQTWALEHAR